MCYITVDNSDINISLLSPHTPPVSSPQVKDGQAPGDLGFDPLNLKPTDPETWEKVQVRERVVW
jgi:hypothetical protein